MAERNLHLCVCSERGILRAIKVIGWEGQSFETRRARVRTECFFNLYEEGYPRLSLLPYAALPQVVLMTRRQDGSNESRAQIAIHG